MSVSPCVNICRIDPATRLCEGCGRTLDEIARWRTLTDGERLRVMAELPERMQKAGLTTPSVTDPT